MRLFKKNYCKSERLLEFAILAFEGSEFREKLICDDKNRFLEIDEKKFEMLKKSFLLESDSIFIILPLIKNGKPRYLSFLKKPCKGLALKHSTTN